MIYVYTSPINNIIVCDDENEQKFLSVKNKTRNELIKEGWRFKEISMPFGFQKRTKNTCANDIKIVPLTDKEYESSIRTSTKYVLGLWFNNKDNALARFSIKSFKFIEIVGEEIKHLILQSREGRCKFVSTASHINRNLTVPKLYSNKNKAINRCKELLNLGVPGLQVFSIRVNNKNKFVSDFKEVEM